MSRDRHCKSLAIRCWCSAGLSLRISIMQGKIEGCSHKGAELSADVH